MNFTLNKELLDKIIFLLKDIADIQNNWDFKDDYGPYGRYTVYEWLDNYNYIWDTAQEILDELENKNEN